ncbi:uncharacterized protein PHACADRAFT_91847 [Phanerochaete carnosa HHB-10118-sp]|uniref:Uncharacterized protein n=1 Tax=Phanerochaete carnosa (strain HHB-10118-sp) TaxID=650164 RepID=K5X1T1_PHACS|nr:uncharacterized protein PHACADRAFT_91847 [Phanerochaete carnosa HHB-10118-sp]EKM56742.1 hypothetical protein PHACADRAFT_91847 [Phanerochaete carnosa HHB-10118-sp]
MSLPNAPKDVSDSPAKGSVVDPVDKQKQAADIDRKLRFYGVINAFKESRMPSNEQIDHTMQYVVNHSPVPENELSPEGRKLIADTRDIIETARLIVKEKNADELFQNFIWHTRDTDLDKAKKDPNEVIPVDQQKAKSDAQQAVAHLRTLLSLILTNAEVRKLLSDFSVIGRDLFARGAAKAAEMARPDEERLRTVDDTAPNDTFHTEDEDGTVRRGDEVVDQAQQMKGEAQDRALDEAQRQKDDTMNAVGGDPVPDNSEEAEAKKNGFMNKLRNTRDNFFDRVPQEHKDRANEQKDRANEHFDRTKRFLADEYFPEERRDQFIFRGKKVVVECQKHKDYQESIRWLLDFVEEYAAHGRTIAGHGKDSHQQLTSDNSLQQATSELRTLLERFANGMSLGIIGDAVHDLYEDAQKDDELRDWFKQCDAYIRKVLIEPGYVLEPDCNNEANRLREGGRRFYDGKYKSHFDNLIDCTQTWFKALAEDPLNQRFGDDWARLTRDLLFDSEGSLKWKPELWMDIRKVIIPSLMDQVGYVPIPRVEYTDDALDVVIENLAFSGRNLFPNIVSMEAHNFIKFSPYNAITDERRHEFTLTFAQIQADMKDVAFYFHKKTGMPKLRDSGIADVLLGGHGMTVTAHVHSADKDPSSVFHVKDVVVKIDTLKFSIRDSKHDLLYKTLRPLATGLIKKQIQKAVADSVRTALEYVDGQLVGVRDRMREAKADENKSRTQVLQEMFQRKKDEAESVKSGGQAKKEERNAQFKIVSKRDSEILQGKGHPAGWVNRTQERAEAATRGEDWRSEAFNIV